MAHLVFQKAIKCLEKEPSLRRPDELTKVQQILLPLAFFSKMMKKNYQRQLAMCIRSMKYKHYMKGETVFHKGEKSNNFYIILAGEVQVLSPREPEAIQHQIEENSDAKRKYQALIQQVVDRKRRFDIFTNLSHKQRLVILYGKYPEQDIRSIEKFIINLIYVRNEFWKNLDFSKLSEGSNHVPLTLSDRNMEYFIPIQELNNKIMFAEIDVPESYFKHGVFAFDLVNTLSGQAFGEGGLILHQGRSASVMCSQDCDLAVVENRDYRLILQDIQQEKMLTKTSLLCQSLSYRLHEDQLAPLMNCFQKVKIKINNYLIREGHISQYIYIIKKGEVLCTRNQSNLHESTNKLQQVAQKTSHIPLALIRKGTLLGYKITNFSAQTVSSFTSLYSAARAQFDQVLLEYPQLTDAFERQNEEFERNLFFTQDKINIKDQDMKDDQIRIDLQDIKQTVERGKKSYGNWITQVCENRQILNRLLIQPKNMTGDQMIRQFDNKAQEKAERLQRQRSQFLRKFKLTNPSLLVSPTVRSDLTTEQKIRIKRKQQDHSLGVSYKSQKQILNLDSLSSMRRVNLETHPDAISINNIQKFLDTPTYVQYSNSQSQQQTHCLHTARFHTARPTTSTSQSQSQSRPMTQFSHSKNSSHNLFRAKNKRDVEFSILHKRKFSEYS